MFCVYFCNESIQKHNRTLWTLCNKTLIGKSIATKNETELYVTLL